MRSFAGPVTEAAGAVPSPPPVPPEPLVAVEAVRRFVAHGGAAGTSTWNVGEVAGFPPDVAASLIERGVARPAPIQQQKAPSGPQKDKMLRGTTTQKK